MQEEGKKTRLKSLILHRIQLYRLIRCSWRKLTVYKRPVVSQVFHSNHIAYMYWYAWWVSDPWLFFNFILRITLKVKFYKSSSLVHCLYVWGKNSIKRAFNCLLQCLSICQHSVRSAQFSLHSKLQWMNVCLFVCLFICFCLISNISSNASNIIVSVSDCKFTVF